MGEWLAWLLPPLVAIFASCFGARAKLEANSAVNEELAFHRQI